MKKEEKNGKVRVNFGEKLTRVGKTVGQSTPVASFWKPRELQLLAASPHRLLSTEIKDSDFRVSSGVSVRKLAATLWELNHYRFPIRAMNQGGGVRLPQPRSRNRRQVYNDNIDLAPGDPSPDFPGLCQPERSSNLRKHASASFMQHRPAERSNHAIQAASHASYGSSMEIAPYNPAITPASSVERHGRAGKRSYGLRTSTELLKVLNRIWSLEEQQSSSLILVKALENELDNARSQIKVLRREQQADRQEMDALVKQIRENKLLEKNKDQDRINETIEAMQEELQEERKSRKHSESLCRKLAREVSDTNSSLARVSKKLENERKSRGLLEELCDEFAFRIRDYEQEMHLLRQKSDKNWTGKADLDHLTLHIAESWLDERMQTKLQHGHEKKSTVAKLGSEIQAFIETRRVNNSGIPGRQIPCDHPNLRRSSLESIQLNTAVSAPPDEDEEDDSVSSDSNCFELEKMNGNIIKSQGQDKHRSQNNEMAKPKQVKKKPGFSDREALKFEKQMAQAVLQYNENLEATETITGLQGNHGENGKSENHATVKCRASGGASHLTANYDIEGLIKNHYFVSESGIRPPDKDYPAGVSIWRSQPSPVRQWTEKLPSHDLHASESSSRLPADLKENSLKSKLSEARTKGQRSRSRIKASIIPRNE